ncbi:hypothetical protein GCM10020216_003060 [Nonomuraea helvata]
MREVAKLECFSTVRSRQRKPTASDSYVTEYARCPARDFKQLLTLPRMTAFVKKSIYPGSLAEESRNKIRMI